MKKKLVCLLLALALSVSALSAFAAEMSEKEKIARLKEIVQGYLDQENLKYTYDDEYELFELSYSLDCTLATCDVTIFLYDDMLSVSAGPSLRVPNGNKDKVAVFLTLANDNSFYAQFRMDYEKGMVSCRNAQLIEQVFPSAGEVDVLLNMALYTLDKYGDGLNKVAQLGVDPHEAFQEVLKAETPNSL